MIRLVAFDLDQTLIGNDLRVSPRVQDAIAQAIARGVYITIVTGREAAITTTFARQLELNAPIVCAQGGLIYDFRSDTILHDERLPAEILPKVVQAAGQHGWNISFELFDKMYLPRISNHPKEFLDLLPEEHCTRVDDLLNDLPDVPRKFLVALNDPADRQCVLDEMRSAFDGSVHIVPTHPLLIEGLPCGVDKGQGLRQLADYLGVKQREIMAVGDNDNDVPMLQWAKIGVAMGHASSAALAVADWVAPDVENDGAAVAIERYILVNPTRD